MSKITFLTPANENSLEILKNQLAREVFAADCISLLSEWSKKILIHPLTKNYPDAATFGFYIRKANLNKLKQQFKPNQGISLGKGVIFHIAPGNVPVNFAYSLVAGLLAGNMNIIKISSKSFVQVDLLIECLISVLNINEFNHFIKRIMLIRYDRNTEINTYLSQLCDVRIIWGGDETIQEIRKSPIPPRAIEITFANRYSIALINSDNYLNSSDKKNIALYFYNDTYLFDQNACTSPHLIIWEGNITQNRLAQELFWAELEKILELKEYILQPVMAVDKLTKFYLQAATFGNINKHTLGGNNIWRITNNSVPRNIENFKCNNGYFNEINITNISEILPLINSKYQTLSYFGFQKDELSNFIKKHTPSGIDRIVPIGRTMDFSLIWDGYNLISSLSRHIE